MSFGKDNHKFSGGNLTQKILPRPDSTEVTKSTSIGEKSVFKRENTENSTDRALQTF